MPKKKSASKKSTSKISKQLKDIRFLLLDVDGVLTDTRLWWIEGTGWTRSFSVKDGYGIKLLMKTGVDVGIITAGDSKSVRERAKVLGISHAYFGDEDKVKALKKIMETTGLKAENFAYVGDELFDIPLLKEVGFSATVPHAVDEVKESVDYITKSEGGMGAVREICDMIRKSHETHSVKLTPPQKISSAQ